MARKHAQPIPFKSPDDLMGVTQKVNALQDIHPEIDPLTLRPYTISPQQRLLLVQAIQQGNTFTAACRLAGVSPHTFKTWMMKGGDPESDSDEKSSDPQEPYKSFAEDVRRAEAESETVLVGRIRGHSTTDWKAASWLLQRRFRDTWGDHDKGVQVTTEGAVQIVLPDNKRDE